MFFIAYAFKGQVHVFAGPLKIVSHPPCRTSAILKYFCPLIMACISDSCAFNITVSFKISIKGLSVKMNKSKVVCQIGVLSKLTGF